MGMSKEEKQAHYAKFHQQEAEKRGIAEGQGFAGDLAVHSEEVPIPCPSCKQITQVAGDKSQWSCSSCSARSWDILTCPKCLASFQLKTVKRTTTNCPWCKTRIKVNQGWPRRSSAWTLNHEMAQRGMPIETFNSDRRVLTGCILIGGHGHDLAPGAQVTVVFDSKSVFLSVGGSEASVIPYSAVTGLEIEGRGVIQSGTQLIGGGFGLAGAAAGMLAASAVNSLTSKTNIETVINLRAIDQTIILFYDQVDPENLKRQLSPAFGRIEAAQRAQAVGAPSAKTDPVAQLAQLDELFKSGALTSDQFEQAKQKIIADM